MSLNAKRIRALYAHYGPTDKLKPNTAVQHIRQLLDEIDELELDAQGDGKAHDSQPTPHHCGLNHPPTKYCKPTT